MKKLTAWVFALTGILGLVGCSSRRHKTISGFDSDGNHIRNSAFTAAG